MCLLLADDRAGEQIRCEKLGHYCPESEGPDNEAVSRALAEKS